MEPSSTLVLGSLAFTQKKRVRFPLALPNHAPIVQVVSQVLGTDLSEVRFFLGAPIPHEVEDSNRWLILTYEISWTSQLQPSILLHEAPSFNGLFAVREGRGLSNREDGFESRIGRQLGNTAATNAKSTGKRRFESSRETESPRRLVVRTPGSTMLFPFMPP